MRKIKVMLVDDSEIFLRSAALALCRLRGIRITDTVASGLEALSAVHTDAPDLVLLDFNMPDMNGVATAARLRSDGYAGKIALMSFSRESEIRDRWPHIEADAFIEKQHFFEGIAREVERLFPREGPALGAS